MSSFPPPPRPFTAPSAPKSLAPGEIAGPPPGRGARPRVPRTHGRQPRLAARIAAAAGVLLLTTSGALAARHHYLPEGTVLPGLRVGGERVTEGASEAELRALVEDRATALLARRVRVVDGDRVLRESTLADLGVRVDVSGTVERARRLGRDLDVLGRAALVARARDGELDVPLRITLDDAAAVSSLLALKEAVDVQPVSARLDLEKHATVPEKVGRYVDADGALARILAAAETGGEVANVPALAFSPRISSAFLEKLEIGTVVAEYETGFSRHGEQARRGKNIDNAAQKLDGLVISPGEMVSFNEIVGERSEANGFQKSWEIFKGEMVEGVGGGTCQVASTFHAAIFFGGFEVLERLPHSRPSAYIPMGLDSTVVFPAVDLKVRNPHPFPVVVHAKTDGPKLRVELLGRTKPVRVGFSRELVETLPYKRKIVEQPEVRGKKVRVKQHGIKGFKVKMERTLHYADGSQKKETSTNTYPPTTEIYEVPVGFDVSLLPPLPEGTGEDAELGGNPSAPPETAKGEATGRPAETVAGVSVTGIEFEDAPGAHAPTDQQANPKKTLLLRR